MGAVPNLFLFSWGYNQHLDVGNTAERGVLGKNSMRELGRSNQQYFSHFQYGWQHPALF